ncbi:MAG: DNA methyltransferase [Bacteroidota bacterium]|jgi:adenine-specific DNA-methyltransferase|nr:type restriction-modification system [Dysgonamonadaceae bacterium]MDK2837866.1 adenine-specific DNA-methyltransferase [Bacteroidota bacterium]MDN5291966.1 adenine-specific DNA-methyltransferase [Anaerophaga sp.]MDN5296617.1 adenine-specific DNA-methyltransferase [Bacteroidota bacterium]
MHLYETLEQQLKKEPNYVTDDGELKKWVVLNKAQNYDEELIELLMQNDVLKEKFFVKVKDVLVFKQNLFLDFLEQKNYLNDSYTRYKNKIGLTIDGKFLKQRNEVALVWPFKDCILEGGQSREEQKREEIFFNEILAQDEITQLLEPKVLTNAKRINAEGEKPLDQFNRNEYGTITDNLIIKGNNLLALHSLKKEFAGKVKLIYIDPPYNTDSDSFKYNDSFNHSSWLTFIKNRLYTAKELLNKEGVIFIHIGDQELHYLKIVADEVFGRDNFIATIPRKTRSGKSDVPWKLSQDFDWMLVYTKSAPKTTQLFKRAIERRYHKSDDFPNDEWRLSDLTTQRSIIERPNSNFTMINPKNGDKYPVNPNRCWSVTVDTFEEFYRKGKIVFPGDYDFLKISIPAMRIFKSEEVDKNGDDFDKTYISSDFLNKAMNELLGTDTFNKIGTDEMVALFGNKKFDYPKNELLLQRIIEYSTNDSDIVLDFFLGSGTTASAAHKMGRQYIGIEQMDYIETVAVERLKKVIGKKVPLAQSEATQQELALVNEQNGEYFKLEYDKGGISKSVNWQGGGSFVYLELKKFNETFIEQIEEAKSTETLLQIWAQMKAKSFFKYSIDLQAFENSLNEFKQFNLKRQKEILCELLDKNQLYVNLSSLNDADFACTEEEKKVTQDFYQLKK